MHNTKHLAALELLFAMTPEEAAAQLGMSVKLLRRWMGQPAFQRAMRERYTERREAARRIAAESTLAAARMALTAITSGDDKGPSRTAIDILKLSGVLQREQPGAEDGDSALAEMIAASMRGQRGGGRAER